MYYFRSSSLYNIEKICVCIIIIIPHVFIIFFVVVCLGGGYINFKLRRIFSNVIAIIFMIQFCGTLCLLFALVPDHN
jgi:hypothetical protein